MTELIVTNGDSTVTLMREAGFAAEILSWRDVLHEGPVPKTANLESLSALRAGFLADAFDMPKNEIADDMERRDRMLRGFDRYASITLWFEHDLYDQLQLLQILDFFHREAASAPLHLVQADDYLGRQTPESIQHFAARRAPVPAEQKALAADLFGAFRQSTPLELAGFLDQSLTPLPYVKAALQRLFEELPNSANGLSRTQHQALWSIEQEELQPKRLFGAVQDKEQAVFMGDWSFWRCLEEMVFGNVPLVEGLPFRFAASLADEDRGRYLDAQLTLTDAGHAVLAGEADHAEINVIDRWLGGTHIERGAIWRWNRDTAALTNPS